ncbi:MAG: excinuclease ABC subunit UvrC [Bacilli bacterium]|nr:excinuclease ABC subunit UvrC [Bacilli bacterium]
MMDIIKQKLSLLPKKPGCYLMKDNTGTIIYVGKAKILKNRVTSYFRGEKTGKTKALVSNIVDFEYIVTESEKEAFLLEINLIKKYDPKYNIIFRDDKTYPYIAISFDKYPKLEVVRPKKRKVKKGTKLFGPYPSAYAAKNIVNMLNRIYPLKKCKNFEDKPCLYYHIGECLGYCQNKIDKEKTDEMVREITSFLNGNYTQISKKLKDDMMEASSKLNFEKAKEIKELLDYIDKVLEKQKIDLTDNINRDIFNYYVSKDFISLQVLHLRGGNLTSRNSYIYELNEEEIDVFNNFIISFYEGSNDIPKEILVPDLASNELLSEVLGIKVTKPTRGPKKKLVDMAYENAKIKLNEKFDLIKNDLNRSVHANEELSKLLGINIHRIESFDNSHLFGNYTVSGMIVFVDGKASKKDYRKYKIVGDAKDDYHLMMEVMERRYSRVINDNLVKPDLILTDGGIIQINACLEALDNLCLDIPVYGMKKNDKHRICALVNKDGEEIEIEKNSDLFHYLEKISEEVHRFTINYHKDIRSKGALTSKLDNIPGIGEKRRKELIKTFKTLKGIKESSDDELEKILPKNVISDLREYFKDDQK